MAIARSGHSRAPTPSLSFSRALALFPLLLLLLLPAGCGDDTASASTTSPSSVVPEVTPAPAASAPSPESQRLTEIADALDHGNLQLAIPLLERLGNAGGTVATLYRARAALLTGDAVASLRAVEVARAAAPREAEVYATAAEIYAALGRSSAAEDEIRAGLERCTDRVGESPPLLRARAILALTRSGGAPKALELLDRALAFEPSLPFTGHARAQAHLLVGRASLQSKAPREALEHARAALDLRPELLDARELEADARAGLGQLDQAIEIREELERAGRDSGAEMAVLHHRAATAALVRGDRPSAISHYLAARARGATDEQLGFGAGVLESESRAALKRGEAFCEAGQLDEARAEFERALELDPSSLQAESRLAAVRFRSGDFTGAAASYERLLARAVERGETLAEPVHLDLARAWRQAGRTDSARGVLETYLASDPYGDWAFETREMLRALDKP